MEINTEEDALLIAGLIMFVAVAALIGLVRWLF